MAIAYGLSGDGKTNRDGIPKDPRLLALLMALTDTRPTGPIALLMPLFAWLARRVRRKGIEEALLHKYYYEQSEVIF